MKMITIYDGIMSDDYYLTMSDLWIASLRFKLPIIFYTSTKFGETETQIIVGNKSVDDKYFFVKFTASKSGTIPKSRLLVNNMNTSKISVNSLSTDLKNNIDNLVLESGIVNYLSKNEFSPMKKRAQTEKKKKKLILKN
jgi:butyrate kinase